MISGLSKLKWVVLFLLIPMAGIAANSNGFVLQLKGPEVYTPSSPNNYGPIVKADTLWSVATATRPDSRLSLYKTMAAILALNPHAFLGGDINKMIDGSFLKIPSAAEIQATDGSALKNALTKKSGTKKKSTPSINTAKPSAKVIVKNKIERDKFALLQGELTESNEHLLLSSETNRRLKLQLESIRMELAELKEQMAIDNTLKADLKALIEQQNARIAEQNVIIESAKKKAVMEAESYNNWWLIGGVSGVFSLLFLVWLGLWLKNRNDQKNNIEDSVMFDADNTVDELSDYLNAESFAPDGAMSMPEEVKAPAGKPADKINTFAAPNLEEPDFNLQLDAEDTVFLDEPNDLPMDSIITKPAAPIMPEIIDKAPVIPELNDNDFSDIDLTLDDESTSFENDSVTPDLSWREELDEPNLIPDDPTNNKNTLDADLAEVDSMLEQFKLSNSQAPGAPTSEAVTESLPVVNDEFVNMDDIDSILAEAELEAIAQADDVVLSNVSDVPDANQVVDMDDIDSLLAEAGLDDIAQAEVDHIAPKIESQQVVDMDDIDSLLAEAGVEVNLPQAHGQTVDEMLAELDGTVSEAPEAIKKPDNADEPLDDIEAMLAEFSPNAFSAAPSEQPPIDVAAAQAEEFIDIDKLLNEASQQPANIEDEPYDKVKLDVGLDEYSNSLFDNNAIDIDDENNRFGAQLDLARAYLEIEDKDGAKSILEPLAGAGDAVQQAEVNKLLSRL
ncbi:putative type IV pilus assembly FimV-related transmembrane protein [Moritella sp. JT01]|uniref:FimV/HubP family polar landmark protein n=1 Tax=Moritella sp. JT01 TaxID=756698 RepID=UPI000798EEF6|nr:FimV/HubP family polar landmark protein [Moritella sp. JT01]KXO07863.1 putative type IV pilus assembly FimV-related transmembrane protein [Moritella sp. JT01]